MSASRRLVGMICVGALARLVSAVALRHDSFDLDTARIVLATLKDSPLDVYATRRFPYPPGYLPVLLAADWLANLTGTQYEVWLHLPGILADALLALVVSRFLLLKGASKRRALAGGALVAIGPTFVVATGYTVQIDALAILPAALALLVWETPELRRRRGLIAGLLIGIGGLIKTVPLLVAAGLLPTARSVRERLQLFGLAAALPTLALVPWLAHDVRAVTKALAYGGVPCFGGLSLLIQPAVSAWVIVPQGTVSLNRFNELVLYWAAPPVGVALLIVSGLLSIRRVEAPRACAVLWLAFFVITPNFLFQYLIWGLPFFLMAGDVAAVAVAEAVLVIPHVVVEMRPWQQPWIGWLYVSFMIAAWLAAAVTLVYLLRPIVHPVRSPEARA